MGFYSLSVQKILQAKKVLALVSSSTACDLL